MQGNYPQVRYDVSASSGVSVFRFGTGPIDITEGGFYFQTRSNQTAILENDFNLSGSAACTISANYLGRTNSICRFTGKLTMAVQLNLNIFSGNQAWASGNSDAQPFEWAGPVVLDQSATRNLWLYLSGGYGSKGIVFSGNVSDGPGPATNRLAISNYGAPFLRFTEPIAS